jgi:GT2 family glycosyltransferase
MPPSLCVLTPSFNSAPYLERCLNSVTAQGAIVRRHIVMDGGSTDGSVDVLRNFQTGSSKLIWHSAPDGGQSDALNKALALVDTPYFAWLNADDCHLPSGLAALADAASRGNTAGSHPAIVYGDYHVIDAEDRLLRRRRQPSFNYWDCLYSYLTVQNCAAIFNTDLCRAGGGFDTSLHFCMDYDVILRLARLGAVRHVRSYVGCFRQHQLSKTSRLQQVCKVETDAVRRRHGGQTTRGMRWRYWLGTARVTSRMIAEGCLTCRIRLPSIYGGAGSSGS